MATNRGYLALLKSARFTPFFLSQVLTNFGDGLFAVVLVYVALKLGASPAQLGIITFCTTLPRGVFGPVGGVIADRMDKKQLLLAVETVRSAVVGLAPLLYLAGWLNVWSLAALGFVVSSLFSIGVPAAKSHIPKLVAAQELQIANSLIQAITWPAYFIGAGLLALAQSVLAPANLFYLVAGCFAASLLALLFIPSSSRRADGERLSLRVFVTDLQRGYQALLSNQVLHGRVALYGVYTFFWRGLLQIGLPLLVLRELPNQAGLYGTLMLVNGLGELLANLVVGKLNFRQPLLASFYGELVIGLAAGVMALSMLLPNPALGLFVAVFLVGISASLIDIPVMTVIQREIPEQHIGKVISYWFTLGSLGGALGTLLGGRALEQVPVATGLGGGAAALLLVFVAMLSWARRRVAGRLGVVVV